MSEQSLALFYERAERNEELFFEQLKESQRVLVRFVGRGAVLELEQDQATVLNEITQVSSEIKQEVASLASGFHSSLQGNAGKIAKSVIINESSDLDTIGSN